MVSTQVRHRARQFGTHWPMIFTLGVVLYFVLSFFNVGARLQAVDLHNPFTDDSLAATSAASDGATQATTKAPSSNVGALRFTVQRVDVSPSTKHPGSLDVRASFEVRNSASENVTFRPDELKVKQGNSVTGTAQASSAVVSPHFAMVIPATFTVSPTKGTSFELLYGDRSIYHGDLTSLR
jgi:hypothetical protein